MSNILITGGTGQLGRSLSGIFSEKLLSHTIASRNKPTGALDWCKLDLATGEGCDEAVSGKKIIFHLASATANPSYATDVEGTKRLLDAAARNGVAHFIYISIVGIDRVPLKYYKIKLKTEAEIQASGVPNTILRATQFHDFVDFMLGRFLRFPVGILPKKALVQPVETRAVAWKLFQLSKGHPLNGTVEMGGPEVLTLGEMANAWLDARRKSKWIVNLPSLNAVTKALAGGGLTTPENSMECLTWQDWLREKYGVREEFLF
jgi:uncharacterized protein YbjT (DUF2867 family)